MGILFISHSGKDNARAVEVRDWLKERGWSQVFLDLDPERGLAPGQRWQQELKQAGERCSGVIVLISPNWVASQWCRTEFLVADQLGKKIFPVFIAPTPFSDVPVELKAKYHIADISTDERRTGGLERLAIGLKRAGLDPRSFEWPPPGEPHRPIYRGLQSLDEADAAIFFGRDALITKGLDVLRRVRDGAPERFVVILSASGAGKSSFLKAGLIARLQRDDENFLVLPVVRPGRAALSGDRGLAASFGCAASSMSAPSSIVPLLAKQRAQVVERFRRMADSSGETYSARALTIVIPIDQAEELFVTENAEAERSLALLAEAVRSDPDTVIVATMRSDAFGKLQNEPKLANVPLLPFSLPPIPHGAFKEVIEGPARLADPPLAIEPALCDRLLQDLAADDALPLLAFTLERLSSRHRGGGTLTLAEYVDELGGLKGAITSAVEAAFSQATRDPALPHSYADLERLARAAFIPALVLLDDADSEPRRRVERLSKLPAQTRALVTHFIDQRLLVSGRSVIDGEEADSVEVAHEAILRQWPPLRAWIAEERDALRALGAARAAAAEWKKHEPAQGQSWLTHRGSRLEEAEALMARPEFAASFGSAEVEYVAACRANENADRLREKEGLLRTRRLQRNIGILIAIAAAVLLFAGVGIAQLLAGITAGATETLALQAAKESEAGNYDRAARYALAGLARAGWPNLGRHETKAEAELRGAVSASSALAVLRGHTFYVLSAVFSPDGKRVITASRDKTARVWDAMTGRPIAVLRGHTGAVMSAAFSPDSQRIVTASEDGTARIWNANTMQGTTVLRGHDDGVVSAAFSPDGTRIVTASEDKTARVWDAHSGHELVVLSGHQDHLDSAAFSPDGTRIVTTSDDKTVRIWDTSSGRELTSFHGHDKAVESAVFSPDGKRVASASDDGTVRIWDAATTREFAVLRGHANAVMSVDFNPDGTRIVTASKDETARIWDADTGRELEVLRGHDAGISGAAFSPDGRRVVTASDDMTARVWAANQSPGLTVLHGHEDAVNSVQISGDGKRIVTGSTDRTVRIWDARTGRELGVLRGHENIVETAAFSPDGRQIVSGSDDKTARLWDAGRGRILAILRGSRGSIYDASFGPDGNRIVTASTDGVARIWHARAAKLLMELRGHMDRVNSASFSHDGRQVVTASADSTARIWDANTGRVLVILRGHEGGVSSASFSRDGTRVVTAGRDRTVRVWDARTGRELARLRGHEDAVLSAVFSRDENLIATTSLDRTARLWNAGTGQEIAVLRGHNGIVNGSAFSPDGTRIVTASDDETARVWNIAAIESVPRDRLVPRICGTVLANGLSRFSPNEIRESPVLDPNLDADACHPPSLWARLVRIFRAGLSR